MLKSGTVVYAHERPDDPRGRGGAGGSLGCDWGSHLFGTSARFHALFLVCMHACVRA